MRRYLSWLGAVLSALSSFGSAIVPVGVFAVLVVGVHAGTDRVDDYAFTLLNAADIVVDSALAGMVETVLGWTGASAEKIARVTFSLQDFVDLDAKHSLSRFVALALEIVSDIALAVPLFMHRARAYSFLAYWGQLSTDPTLLRIVAPLAVLLAGGAGTLLVAQEVQVGVHGWLVQYPDLMENADPIARTAAVIAVLLVAWRLGTVALRRSVSLAEAQAQKDHRMMSSVSKRRLRGLFIALVVLPLSALALTEAAPPWSALKALFGG